MVAARPQDADRLVAKPPAGFAFFLVYGPDDGLVSERASRLVAAFADPGDPFAVTRIDASELSGGSTRLADEAYAVSMFSSRRVIVLREAGGRVDVSGRLATILAAPPPDLAIVVEAGDLKKTNPLRALFEKAANASAIPCYADDAAAVGRLVDEEVKASGLAIAAEARALVVELLGGDRLMTRGEIQKLCLYARGKAEITLADVEALIGDSSTLAAEAIVDATSTGAVAALAAALAKARTDGIDAGQLAGAALRHFMQLDDMRAQVDRGRSPSEVVETARPPVFFKRKAAFERSLGLWNGARLERAVTLLGETAREARLNAALAPDIVGEAFLTLSRAAAQFGRGRR
jgi:DNA polymerase-3 subunit delta